MSKTQNDMASRAFKAENTIVTVGNATFGNGMIPVIAGPCSVETEEQIISIARNVKAAGATLLRGGAFKPRTSPYSFQGLGKQGIEFLMSAEYILSSGNPNVILCERGIRTFDNYARNCLDISIIPYLHQVTHLPIIVDPSHACGARQMVADLAKSAIACNADGLMIEVHNNPDDAVCDGEQSLHPEEFSALMKILPQIAAINGRKI